MKYLAFRMMPFVFSLAGFSTTLVSTARAVDVPANRIFQPSYVGAAESPQDGTIVFQRGAGLSDLGCSYEMYIDSVKVFAISHGSQIKIHLPAGRHLFRVETGVGSCPNVAASKEETTIHAGRSQDWLMLLLSPPKTSLRLARLK